jgi:hypothetical protein
MHKKYASNEAATKAMNIGTERSVTRVRRENQLSSGCISVARQGLNPDPPIGKARHVEHRIFIRRQLEASKPKRIISDTIAYS